MSDINEIKIGTYVRIKDSTQTRGRIEEIVNDHLGEHATVKFPLENDKENTVVHVQRNMVEIIRREISQNEAYNLLKVCERIRKTEYVPKAFIEELKNAITKARGEK